MTRIIVFILSLLLVSCASSSETAKDSQDSESQEVYIFDDMTEETGEIAEVEAPAQPQIQETVEEPASVVQENVEFYIVQIGAFTTESRALSFVAENKDKLEYEMTIHYGEDVKLYVVQLPPFRTREKAEEVRNSLWNTGKYNDAFIVPK